MQFLYAIINFLILAGLLWLFGRKMIGSIFKNRLDRINRELDEAEQIEKIQFESPSLPDIPMTADKGVNDSIRAKLDEIEEDSAARVNRIKKHADAEILEMCYEVVSAEKKELVENIKRRASELIHTEPYKTTLYNKQYRLADMILSRIKLTPGDIAYLNNHDVLYVTLTSAEPLPEEIVKKIDEKTTAMLSEVNGKSSYWVQVDEKLIGGFRLRIGDTIYDCTVANQLYELERELEKRPLRGDETPEGILEDTFEGISVINNGVTEFQVGRVISISDGICWLDGLADIMYGEVIEFDCGERGMILDIEPHKIGCIVYGDYEHIESGSRVRRVGRIAGVAVGEELLGRVVDPLGHALDGKGRIWTKEKRHI